MTFEILLKNGDFKYGLEEWHVKGDANVQQINGTPVLVIPN
jgi:hypothetical protein